MKGKHTIAMQCVGICIHEVDSLLCMRSISFFFFLSQCELWHIIRQAPVVQTMDSAIHRINYYPADKHSQNQLSYPVDSDLSRG